MSLSANAAKLFFRQTQSTWRKLQAWHTWVLICAAGAGVTFCLNIALTVWAAAFGFKNGVATLKEGKCSDVKTWDLWIHLGINVLSTTLLAASNYTMQCLSAPVREEIDRGHCERVALDIGIPSLKNLRGISRIKVILWALLAVSSIPLHLLYNSVVFSTLSTHSYTVLVITSEFLSGAPFWNATQYQINIRMQSASLEIIASYLRKAHIPQWQINQILNLGMDRNRIPNPGYYSSYSSNLIPSLTPMEVADIKELQSNVTVSKQDPAVWERISPQKCRETYRTQILSDRSDVLVVSSAKSLLGSLLYYINRNSTAKIKEAQKSDFWTCTDSATQSMNIEYGLCVNSTSEYFQLSGYPIDYCLSRKRVGNCQLQFSLPIMIIVIICNLTKAVCMLLTLRHRFTTPLLTLGDAVASFLKRPDIYTRNNCLSDRYNFRRQSKIEKRVEQLGLQLLHALLCKPSCWRYFQYSRLKQHPISTDDSLNGEELQDLVAGKLPLKNHDLLEHQDWRECVRASRFLASISFNGQRVQDLIAGERPLKRRCTLHHDNYSLEHEGWRQTIKEWEPKRHFWFSVASPSRWLFSLSL